MLLNVLLIPISLLNLTIKTNDSDNIINLFNTNNNYYEYIILRNNNI